MNEDYKIKYEAMDELCVTMNSRISEWSKQLDAWEKAYTKLVEMSDFKGKTAEAIKDYFTQVHGTILWSIRNAMSRLQSDFLIYKKDYYDIEEKNDAVLTREKIINLKKIMNNELGALDVIDTDISESFKHIADIYDGRKPYSEALFQSIKIPRDIAKNLDENIQAIEDKHYKMATGDISKLLTSIKIAIGRMEEHSSTSGYMFSYKAGNIKEQSSVVDMCKNTYANCEYLTENAARIKAIAEYQQRIYDEKKKKEEEIALKVREEEGKVKLMTGGIGTVAGSVAIIAAVGAVTGGAGVPVLISGMSFVAGTSSVTYGIGNITEGVQDIDYSKEGDTETESLNFVKMGLFGGNEELYELWGSANIMTAGITSPGLASIKGMTTYATQSKVMYTIGKTICTETIIDTGSYVIGEAVVAKMSESIYMTPSEELLMKMGVGVTVGIGLHTGVDALGNKLWNKPATTTGIGEISKADIDDGIKIKVDGGESGKTTNKISGTSYDINKLKKTQPYASSSKVDGIAEYITENGPNSLEPIRIRVHEGVAYIEDGHHRYEAFMKLGYDRVPVKYLHSSNLGKILADGTRIRNLDEIIAGAKLCK